MTTNKWLLPIVLLFLTSSALATDQIISPDKTLIAVIEPFLKTKESAAENVIKILRPNGTLLAIKDLRSKDKEHGLVIDKIQWTSDSKFLVFSTYTSGGHQPWHTPTFFFSRSDSRIHSLDDMVGNVLESDFEILSNGDLKVVIQDKKTGKEKEIVVRLSDLVKK